jgi:hypothetical protein
MLSAAKGAKKKKSTKLTFRGLFFPLPMELLFLPKKFILESAIQFKARFTTYRT